MRQRLTVAGVVRALALAWLALCVLVAAGAFVLVHYPRSVVADRPGPDELRFLDQGWTAEDRDRYSFTPQGTSLKNLRYRWFVSLELPWGRKRFADPDHMRAYGFLVDPGPSR